MARTTFTAIGTHWDIQIHESLAEKAWAQLIARLHQRIEAFDKSYSRFRSDSLVTRMSQNAGTYALPPDGFRLLELYEKLYQLTEGKMTPLIGQAVADAGYDASYSFAPKTLHAPPRWEDVLAYNSHEIILKKPALLDFGAAGKGYLVDLLGELIERAGVHSYLINAGGDIRHRSAEGAFLTVGLENPSDTSEAIGVVELKNQNLCASAGSKRKWAKFHHIIDPHDLRSPEDTVATWVLADDTLTADALATALFFQSAAPLAKAFPCSYAILSKDMELQYSKDFPIRVFEATA